MITQTPGEPQYRKGFTGLTQHPIQLTGEQQNTYTMLSDLFIDLHMPSANGEFVKIYIYLLHLLQKNSSGFSLTSAADVFSCTESDIMRALLYWENRGLIALDRDEETIAGIRLIMPAGAEHTAGSSAPDAVKQQAGKSAPDAVKQQAEPGVRDAAKGSFTPLSLSDERRRQLMTEQAEVSEIMMIAEEYLGRTLSTSDQNRLLYLYDELHFSVDLLDYLIEYCVLKEKRSMHYIEKVGLEWYNDGVRTVAEAKERTNLWNREYYAILRAFGITGRNPVLKEITFMQRWLNTLGFSTDLIREACGRTVSQTGRPSFDYADRILSSWHEAGVHTLADVERLDSAHAQKVAEQKQKAQDQKNRPDGSEGHTGLQNHASDSRQHRSSGSRNRFNNFNQRDYDYGALEQELLRRRSDT